MVICGMETQQKRQKNKTKTIADYWGGNGIRVHKYIYILTKVLSLNLQQETLNETNANIVKPVNDLPFRRGS